MFSCQKKQCSWLSDGLSSLKMRSRWLIVFSTLGLLSEKSGCGSNLLETLRKTSAFSEDDNEKTHCFSLWSKISVEIKWNKTSCVLILLGKEVDFFFFHLARNCLYFVLPLFENPCCFAHPFEKTLEKDWNLRWIWKCLYEGTWEKVGHILTALLKSLGARGEMGEVKGWRSWPRKHHRRGTGERDWDRSASTGNINRENEQKNTLFQ